PLVLHAPTSVDTCARCSPLSRGCRGSATPVFPSLFPDTPTTEIYTLSLHDALPIYAGGHGPAGPLQACAGGRGTAAPQARPPALDRKSTRLNSSHVKISYAVFCLKKKRTPRGPGRSPEARGESPHLCTPTRARTAER